MLEPRGCLFEVVGMVNLALVSWPRGLAVWFSLRVREVPGSIPGVAQPFYQRKHVSWSLKCLQAIHWVATPPYCLRCCVGGCEDHNATVLASFFGRGMWESHWPAFRTLRPCRWLSMLGAYYSLARGIVLDWVGGRLLLVWMHRTVCMVSVLLTLY